MSSANVEFVGAVKTFNELFKRSESSRNNIQILKSDDIMKFNGIEQRLIEEVQSILVGWVAIGDEDEFLVRLSRSDRFVNGDGGRQSIASRIDVVGRDF